VRSERVRSKLKGYSSPAFSVAFRSDEPVKSKNYLLSLDGKGLE
jgi:hypothetical protein